MLRLKEEPKDEMLMSDLFLNIYFAVNSRNR